MIAASTPGWRFEPKEWRRLCSVGAIWSMANAKRPRRSSGAVVWFKPRAQTDITRDYKISRRIQSFRGRMAVAMAAITLGCPLGDALHGPPGPHRSPAQFHRPGLRG